MEKCIVSKEGGELLNVLKYEQCLSCIDGCKDKDGYTSLNCPVLGTQKRIGYLESTKGYVKACDDKQTTRNFKIELQNALDCIPQLIRFRKEISKSILDEERQRTDRIVHNLKTQNAHAIQELSNFIQDEEFVYDIRSVIPSVKERVKKKTHHAAYTLLRLGKINTAMSGELFIYEHITHNETPYALNIRRYDLHDVLMLVFHEFMPDFTDKQVSIDVEPYEERVHFDFTVVRFIFYHLIANAQKYIRPLSTLSVRFGEDTSNHIVTFQMSSYHMYPEDIENMYKEGYSGKIAVEQKSAGQGLGMYLVQKMVKLHQAELKITPGEELKKSGKINYSDNRFDLFIPKANK